MAGELLIIIITGLWLARSFKAVLFWVYLWQLKEYHLGRFRAHFSTAKGKELVLDRLILIKLLVIAAYVFSPLPFFYLLAAFLYSLELVKAGKDLISRKLKRPVFTQKAIFLCVSNFSVLIVVFLFAFRDFSQNSHSLDSFAYWLVLADVILPAVVSVIILALQPFTVLARNITVNKARKKLASYPKLLVIGVTGSYGKTSVKEFLAEILSAKLKVLKTKANQNSEIGISRCILNELTPEHEIFIVEMGAYERGVIKFVCGMVKPKIGILTGINEQHLATFGSQENIVAAKFELLESLPEDGIAIVNADSELISQGLKKNQLRVKTIKSCSAGLNTGDLRAENIAAGKDQISFIAVTSSGEKQDFTVNLFGRQNIVNLLMASQAAKELGMTLAEISQAAIKITAEEAALKFYPGKNGIQIYDATYSANPNSVLAHLEHLSGFSGKKAIIMPSLIELGKASFSVHERIGRQIAKTCDLAIVTTKDGLEGIRRGASFNKKVDILFLENPSEIARIVLSRLQTNDIILLESRVAREVITLLKQPL